VVKLFCEVVNVKYEKKTIDDVNRIFASADEQLLLDLSKYGEKTGRLSVASILRVWNGVSADKLPTSDLDALIEFLQGKYGKEFLVCKNSLYDKEINKKQKYLLLIQNQAKRAAERSLLNRVHENIESVFKKDICELTAEELSAGFSNMGYNSKRVAANDLSMIKHYLEWCYKEGYYVPAYSAINQISIDDIGIRGGLRNSIVPTPEDLANKIVVVKQNDSRYNDVMVICLFWMGLIFDEIYDLRIDDVLIDDCAILNPYFEKVIIPEPLVPFFKAYIESQFSQSSDAESTTDKSRYFIQQYVKRSDGSSDGRMHPQRIRVLVNEFKNKYNNISNDKIDIAPPILLTSGACWRIYQQEQSGLFIDDDLIRYEARITSSAQIRDFKEVFKQYKEIFFGA